MYRKNLKKQKINRLDNKDNSIDLSFINNTEKYSVEFLNIEETVTPTFIKNLRSQFNMSQVFFAKVLGVSNKTVEKWEQGKNPVLGTAARLLFSIKKNPEMINDYFIEHKSYSSNDIFNKEN